MNIILTAVDPALADAWERACGDLEFCSVHRGSILDLRVDAVVSPANSFGFMDGGIDSLYSARFGPGLQEWLQARIRNSLHGELLVGNATIVSTDDPAIPWLIAAPTMRVPMRLAPGTINPYLAACAALGVVKWGILPDGTPVCAVVRSIAFPGLATGTGGVPPGICAAQVRHAIEKVVLGRWSFPDSARIAAQHQDSIACGMLSSLERLRRQVLQVEPGYVLPTRSESRSYQGWE